MRVPFLSINALQAERRLVAASPENKDQTLDAISPRVEQLSKAFAVLATGPVLSGLVFRRAPLAVVAPTITPISAPKQDAKGRN
jgi:hypothetical protein